MFRIALPLIAVLCSLSPLAIAKDEKLLLREGDRLFSGSWISRFQDDEFGTDNPFCRLKLQTGGVLEAKRVAHLPFSLPFLRPAWAAHPYKEVYTPYHGYFLSLKANGDLVIKKVQEDWTEKTVWSSNTARQSLKVPSGKNELYIDEDCRLILKKGGQEFWTNVKRELCSGDHLQQGELFHPEGSDYTMLLQYDGNLVIFEGRDLADVELYRRTPPPSFTWTSGSGGGHATNSYLGIQRGGNLVIYENVFPRGTSSDVRWSWLREEGSLFSDPHLGDYCINIDSGMPVPVAKNIRRQKS